MRLDPSSPALETIVPPSSTLPSTTLILPQSQRGVLIGQTGTGKSTLAKQILRFSTQRPALIVDGKGDFEPGAEEWLETDSAARAGYLLGRYRNVIYRPHPEESDMGSYDNLFRMAFWAAVPLVYIDEIMMCVKNAQTYPVYLRSLFQQGRSRGISVLAGTQRPAGVPVFVFSESEQKWCFELITLDDRQRVSEWMGEQLIEQGWPDRFSFWYRNQRERRPRYCKLSGV